ncbi:metalloprotease [uncultured Algibacter sp.]|uniref:metalloprotease n=1 Tax=uncultured Algibacter sp. TaxID=298659 RepID=UPI002638A2BC|nr:metalloprotease [uncultured Algibacter sp.]
MKLKLIALSVCFLMVLQTFSQNKIDLKADFDISNKEITISQSITYTNETQDELKIIYLNDWNNSYATKKTPLAIRIADEYVNDFHLAKNEDRGYSVITSIKQNKKDVRYEQVKNQIDVIKVVLNTPLKPNQSYTLELNYIVKIPSNKFTNYGITKEGDVNLRYWFITPAIYNGKWRFYSNKNLDDLFIPKADLSLEIKYPNGYYVTSDLDLTDVSEHTNNQTIKLEGKDRINNRIYFNKEKIFNTVASEGLSITSSIDDEGLELMNKVLITDKIKTFLEENFGKYPHKKLVVSEIDYNKDPVYGLNLLPDFIKPYPSNFEYELKLLKVIVHNYLENTLLINPREEQWLLDGIHIFYLMKYIDEHYPNMKFLGSIADIWGVRSFHAADMTFNDKYVFAYMSMARTNRDQPLTMAKDSLLKFNKNIANKYKAGVGFKYLDDFINSDILENSIESFLVNNKLQNVTGKDFESYLKTKTSKSIDWFFTDYLSTRKKIDFKIKDVHKTEDSVTLTIRNKRENNMPISLYALKNDSIVSKTWVENINENKTITIPRNGANKLVLNYDKIIPEYNLRDNWKSLKGFFFNNKPLQFRLIKDIEDPYYNQVFLMPIVEFNNIYDGLTLGARAYNTTLLRKRFNYKIAPKYSLKSRSLTGGASVIMTHFFEDSNLFAIKYGIGTSYTSYAEDLFVRQIKPTISFSFRQNDDFRSNKRQSIILRYLDINRDEDPNDLLNETEPNYSVFNARYIHSNDNLINFSKWYADFQVAKTFSKVSFNYEYRKLFESNRQLNLRFFAGTFLSNKSDVGSDYFSFALDRPTDYLFDYAYLGRSENSGIFSQQYIDAEGGFKSKLDTPFANQWITTLNTSTTLWKYILAYGDIGLVKNKFNDPHFVYDSGIRVNLVTDYFEIYFPIYSNLGWEMGQPHYDEKIRFKFTVDPQSLLGLFRRRWY